MPADPYDFAPRNQAKLALLIAINARNHVSAVRALADALRCDNTIVDRFKTADRLLKAAKCTHPDIAWALASDSEARRLHDNINQKVGNTRVGRIADAITVSSLAATGQDCVKSAGP